MADRALRVIFNDYYFFIMMMLMLMMMMLLSSLLLLLLLLLHTAIKDYTRNKRQIMQVKQKLGKNLDV